MARLIASSASQGGAAPRPLPAPGRLHRLVCWGYRTLLSLPAMFRAGFGLLAAGGVADVVYHLIHGLKPAHSHGTGLDVPTAIHLLVAAGMAVTLVGLVQAGIRSARTSDDDKEAI